MSTFEECKRNRTEWISELQEGGRQQTNGVLATTTYDAFCCLGVAEETVGKNVLGIKRFEAVSGYYVRGSSRKNTSLHETLRIALGLTKNQEAMLIALNDGTEASFYQIGEIASLMDYFCEDGIFNSDGKRIGMIDPVYYTDNMNYKKFDELENHTWA